MELREGFYRKGVKWGNLGPIKLRVKGEEVKEEIGTYKVKGEREGE